VILLPGLILRLLQLDVFQSRLELYGNFSNSGKRKPGRIRETSAQNWTETEK
jgi:hypothetical protein